MGFLSDLSGLFDDIKDIQHELNDVKNELVSSIQDTVTSAATATTEIEQAARQKTDEITNAVTAVTRQPGTDKSSDAK